VSAGSIGVADGPCALVSLVIVVHGCLSVVASAHSERPGIVSVDDKRRVVGRKVVVCCLVRHRELFIFEFETSERSGLSVIR
jgi:hypothetical protein